MKLKELERIIKPLRENPYIPLVLALGLMLMLLPGGESKTQMHTAEKQELSAPGFSLEAEEKRLCHALERISGVGEAEVLLSLRSTARRDLATSMGEAVVLSAGSGKEQAVEEGYLYPEYQGAVVVCSGAESAAVRLQVSSAVSAFTGLGSQSIQVLKME